MTHRRPIPYAVSCGGPTRGRQISSSDGSVIATAEPGPVGSASGAAARHTGPRGGGKLSRNPLKTPNRAGKGRLPRSPSAQAGIERGGRIPPMTIGGARGFSLSPSCS